MSKAKLHQQSKPQAKENSVLEELRVPSATLKKMNEKAVSIQLELAASPLGQSLGLWIAQKKPDLFLDTVAPFIFYRTSSVGQSANSSIPLTMAVKISPDTTLGDLKDLWPKIKSWKAYLKKIQPAIPQQGVQGIQGLGLRLHRQHTKKPEGKGYGTLAKDLNQELEGLYQKAVDWEAIRSDFELWLTNFPHSVTNSPRQFSRWLKEIPAAQKKYGATGDTLDDLDMIYKLAKEPEQNPNYMITSYWLAQGDSVFLDGARRLLEFFNFEERDIKAYSQDAMEYLRQGQWIPWAKGEGKRGPYTSPITTQQVRGYLDKLRGTTNRFL